MTDKKVKLNLVGLDGNAFSLLGAFQAQARKEKWTSDEIKEVREEAMSGDWHNHLLVTLMNHTDSPDEDEYDNDDFEDDWDDYEDDEDEEN